MNSVWELSAYSEDTLNMNGVCCDGDWPKDLRCPNKVMRGRVVDNNVDCGRRGCPPDFGSLNKEWIDPLGCVELVGQV
jgi:hypothetical protein